MWEEEFEGLPEKFGTLEDVLDTIEELARRGYKQIKTAEDVSPERLGGPYNKIYIMRLGLGKRKLNGRWVNFPVLIYEPVLGWMWFT